MLYIILYLLIGLVIAYDYFNTTLGEEYAKAKMIGEVNDAYVCLYLLLLVMIWPIVLGYIIYKKLK